MSSVSQTAPVDLAASFAHCGAVAKRAGKNFYYSFLTLPADQRRDMCALYAYMRLCDDIGDDESVTLPNRRTALAAWRDEVQRVLAGDATTHLVLPALADVVARRRIPHGPLLDVIDGIESDLSPVAFETFEQLADYCYHVAGAVGICCIHIWGFTGDAAIARAIDCGLAFQLTNILRDLGEDARMGRIYLPAEDLRRFGYTAADLQAGTIDDRFRALMAFQVARARDYYCRAAPLFDHLAPSGRPVLAAMRHIYGGLLDAIERRGYDVFRSRIALPKWKKLAIVARCLLLRG